MIIGISGKAGSGKDFLTQKYFIPNGYFQFSLAWHFKVWLVGKGEATHEEIFVTKPPHIRTLLQQEGTERGRNVYGDDVWCNTLLEWSRVLKENCGVNNIVIPDVRFPNEVEFIQKMGGAVFRIHAPGRVANSGLSEQARQHISETALDDYPSDYFDAIIYNDYAHEHEVGKQILQLLEDV